MNFAKNSTSRGKTEIVNNVTGGHRRNFGSKWASDKQHNYAEDMLRTCKSVGIDVDGMNFNTLTKAGCQKAINAAHTLLKKNGYDARGNKITTYNLKDK